MKDAPAFIIKGDAHAFMMGENGRRAHFVIKGDMSLATRAHVRVSDVNLTEKTEK
jgi:hypothetical protein